MSQATTQVRHPAKFSQAILDEIALRLRPGWKVLDPFAGTGKLAEIPGIHAVCVEIEPEWATGVIGDALALPFRDGAFDAICTSPVYGNRMSDHHDARDGSRRHTYKHYLGRDLHPRNSGQLQWGNAYRRFHTQAWTEVVRTLKHEGMFLLNSSDHVRKGEVQRVTDWHVETLLSLGLLKVAQVQVGTPRLRHGENHTVRVDHESLTIFRRMR